MSSSVGTNQDVAELEDALKQLRIAYEKYFAGVERIEPLKQRDTVRKQILRLVGENTKNTARRFRQQSLQASLVSYEQHWNRITRQIEEGTFKRDRLKAARRAGGPAVGGWPEEQDPLEPEALPGSGDLEELDAEHVSELGSERLSDLEAGALPDRPSRRVPEPTGGAAARSPTELPGATAGGTQRAVPRAASTPSPLDGLEEMLALAAEVTRKPASGASGGAATPGASSPAQASRPSGPGPERAAASRTAVPPFASTGFSSEVRRLHQAYVTSRDALGERDPVSLDAFAATLQKQAAAIKDRLKCREVEFKVAVKDGKTILKATPKT